MPGCGRIAHQNHILMVPFLADDPREIHPDSGTAQVIRVGNEPVAIQMIGEDFLACPDGVLLGHGFKAPFVPGFLRTLDNDRRRISVELIGVNPHPALFGLFENERKRVIELLVGAKPDELAQADVDVRA